MRAAHRATAASNPWIGAAGWAVVSSIVQPQSPASIAAVTVAATSSGEGPKPSSRSAETGRSTAPTSARAFSSASARETAASPSRRPSMKANPAEVLATASKPSPAISRALP